MNRNSLLILIGILVVVAVGASYLYYQERQSGIDIQIESYAGVWVTRPDQAALVLAGPVLATPSVNLTPSMTRGN